MAGVHTRRRLARPAAVALALACGCGRSTEESTDRAAPSQSAVAPGAGGAEPLPSCALMPPAEVAAALDVGALEVPQADIRGLATTCIFAGDGAAARVTLRFEMRATAATLAAARAELEAAGQRVADVAGVGDRAFAATAADGRRTLAFQVGAVQMAIGSTDPLTRQKRLAARVIERLRR